MNLLEIRLEKLISVLGTDLEIGLTGEQVLQNRREFGENVLFEKKNTVPDLIKKIFGDVMMVLFLLISLFDFLESGDLSSFVSAITVIVLYSAFVFGSLAYQRRTQALMKRDIRTRYRVRRSGSVRSVAKSELVPGDILLLEKGDVIPCDGIILKHRALKILEAGVTGRRVPVFKRSHEEVDDENSGLPYFDCLLFAGSVILHGNAKVFVCNTGHNIFDRDNFTLSRQNTTVPEIYRTAMELKKQSYLIWVLSCFVLFAWGVFRGQEVFDAFHYVTAIIVAAFPDAMEHLCDLSLSYMTKKLFSEGVILRNPGAIDRLCDANSVFVHSADYLFHSSPIAGTFYVGDERYEFSDSSEAARPLLENLLLAQSSRGYFVGKKEETQSEKALEAAAASIGLQKSRLNREYLHITSFDLDERLGYSAALVMKDGSYRLIVRGNPASVLTCCSHRTRRGEVLPMTEGDRAAIRVDVRHLAGLCERVFAVAVCELSSPPTGDLRKCCRDMTYLGLFGLSTPISAAAATAVSLCQKSGISTYLLTDDYPETVLSLSKSVSIIGPQDYQYALSHQTYERMDRGVFVADIEKYKAFSGFPVEEKQNIIKFHKDNGNITLTLTGGLYDTLPQMESDVSIVDAEEKTNAVRLNADLFFHRKRFELIPFCINWARIFYRNVVHLMQYVLLNQFALAFAVLISFSVNGTAPIPLLPMVIASLSAPLVSGFNVFHRVPSPRLEDSIGVLKEDRLASVRAMLIVPLLAGTVQAIAMMLSHRVAFYASGSAHLATVAALITYVFSSWINSLTVKYDSSFFGHLKEFGKCELITLLIAVLVIVLTTASPLIWLWHASIEVLRFWPLFFALIFSFLPFGLLEGIKALRKDDSVALRDS